MGCVEPKLTASSESSKESAILSAVCHSRAEELKFGTCVIGGTKLPNLRVCNPPCDAAFYSGDMQNLTQERDLL